MSELAAYIDRLLDNALAASRQLAGASTAQKDEFLLAAADSLFAAKAELQAENAKDIAAAEKSGLSPAMIDRLRLTDDRIDKMAKGLRAVAALADPVGIVLDDRTRPNGLRITKVSVPIGVVCIIYESRPDVTADAAALCIKSGNAVILRGGKEAIHSNLAINRVIADALEQAGLDPNGAQLLSTTDREAIDLLLAAEGRLDVVIPRGGEGLIRAVVEKSKVPVIKHYKGICHTYVDADADLDLAESVCLNAKLQRASVCNAMETLLVHRDVAEAFLPRIAKSLVAGGCELRGCDAARPKVRRCCWALIWIPCPMAGVSMVHWAWWPRWRSSPRSRRPAFRCRPISKPSTSRTKRAGSSACWAAARWRGCWTAHNWTILTGIPKRLSGLCGARDYIPKASSRLSGARTIWPAISNCTLSRARTWRSRVSRSVSSPASSASAPMH